MEPIYIPQLARAPEQTEKLSIEDYLPDLETLTLVQGEMQVIHRGNYLEVTATAETIVTLTCDRCLQQYNHRLAIEPSELIWLEPSTDEAENLPLEREVPLVDLVETLDPQGYFDPQEWLYQQLCLEIPQRQLCDLACVGIAPKAKGESLSQQATVDRRWSSLESLKKHLPH